MKGGRIQRDLYAWAAIAIMVMLGLVERSDRAVVVVDWANVVANNVNHHPNSTLVAFL